MKKKLFKPTVVATRLHDALCRDLRQDHQVYVQEEASKMLKDRMEKEFLKKFVDPLDKDESRSLDALLKFLEMGIHIRESDERLTLPLEGRPCRTDTSISRVLKRAKSLIKFVLGSFETELWFQACKHGPGSSIGVSFSDTSLEAKFSLPMSATKKAIPLLDEYLLYDVQLVEAVKAFHGNSPIGEWYDEVMGSRATTVPKTASIDRMIAVEPTGNMFLQQGLMSYMYDKLKEVGLDVVSLPSLHVKRARLASITSNEATIDWSCASDTVSYKLLGYLLPPDWFDVCDKVRSPSIFIHDGWIDCPMFATMGNAVTFPLETLVLWAIGHATLLESQGTYSSFPEWESLLKVSVFGDDCIVPSTIARQFIENCRAVGFVVNEKKTFINGSFRESCGGDFLHGQDVRPFNLKAPTSCRASALEPWLYVIGNRVLSKYQSIFGPRNYAYYTDFFSTLGSIFRENNLLVKVVPTDFPDDAGMKIIPDLHRLSCFFPLGRVARDQHGSVSFLFTRYRYWVQRTYSSDLRYWQWLKTHRVLTHYSLFDELFAEPCLSIRDGWMPEKDIVLTRKRGGYVVARSASPRWA